jgi:hypothetical protein
VLNEYHYRKAQSVMRRGLRNHYVYFALASGPGQFVKIGTTYDVERRLTDLRNGGTKEPQEISGNLRFYLVIARVGTRR